MRFVTPSWTVLLALAGGSVALAATPVIPQLPSASDPVSVSGWVLADLNGDDNVDLATARSERRDADGYAQEVRVTLGAFQQTSFRFRSPGARVELDSRDLDGDKDSDLVILEPLSGAPISVWINDGTGSFHEGRLADFAAQLGHQAPPPRLLAPFHRAALFAISEERLQLALPATVATATRCTLELLAPRGDLPGPAPVISALGSRAPPSRA